MYILWQIRELFLAVETVITYILLWQVNICGDNTTYGITDNLSIQQWLFDIYPWYMLCIRPVYILSRTEI